MTVHQEAFCARQIRLLESEEFLAIGGQMGPSLDPEFARQQQAGRAHRLPDLLSVKREGSRSAFRLREVKFKLHDPLIRKALGQLLNGVALLQQKERDPLIDRLEIVVPLKNRRLGAPEMVFLGAPIGAARFHLQFEGAPVTLRSGSMAQPVTVLLL